MLTAGHRSRFFNTPASSVDTTLTACALWEPEGYIVERDDKPGHLIQYRLMDEVNPFKLSAGIGPYKAQYKVMLARGLAGEFSAIRIFGLMVNEYDVTQLKMLWRGVLFEKYTLNIENGQFLLLSYFPGLNEDSPLGKLVSDKNNEFTNSYVKQVHAAITAHKTDSFFLAEQFNPRKLLANALDDDDEKLVTLLRNLGIQSEIDDENNMFLQLPDPDRLEDFLSTYDVQVIRVNGSITAKEYIEAYIKSKAGLIVSIPTALINELIHDILFHAIPTIQHVLQGNYRKYQNTFLPVIERWYDIITFCEGHLDNLSIDQTMIEQTYLMLSWVCDIAGARLTKSHLFRELACNNQNVDDVFSEQSYVHREPLSKLWSDENPHTQFETDSFVNSWKIMTNYYAQKQATKEVHLTM